MKKLWTALLLIAVLLGLLSAAAVADSLKNIRISDVEYYASGCLKGFTLSSELGHGNATEFRVSVQTKQFRKQVDDNLNGDFTNHGVYHSEHHYTYWPEAPADCDFVTWAGRKFLRSEAGGKETSLTVTFSDGQIKCNENQTYHMYLWVKYYEKNVDIVYPDSFVATFKTGSGKIESEAIKDDGVTPRNPANDPSNIPPKDPSNDTSNIPPKAPTNDSSNIPLSNSSNAAQDIPATVDLPKTGDDSQMVLWLAMSLLAGAGLLALTRRRASER